MFPSTDYGGIPVGAKSRIVMSVLAGVFFGFLLFVASVNLKWFTTIRGLYLILGIANGLLIGFVEAREVIRGVNEKAKATVWQPLAISFVTFALPFLLVVAVFGVSEYLPFGGYVALSAVPVYYAVTGWRYNETEKRSRIRILKSLYGLTYWKEPIPDHSNILASFISDLATKDYSWVMNPRGYIGHAPRLKAALEAKNNVEPSTKKALMDIIQVMNKYRRQGLLLFAVFMASMPLLAVWLLVLTSTSTFGLQQVVGGRIVSGREITLVLGIIPFVTVFASVLGTQRLLKKKYERRMLSLLASVDADKFYSIL